MAEYETFECDRCGWGGNRLHPVTGVQLGDEYEGDTLCSTCRVDARLEGGDYA